MKKTYDKQSQIELRKYCNEKYISCKVEVVQFVFPPQPFSKSTMSSSSVVNSIAGPTVAGPSVEADGANAGFTRRLLVFNWKNTIK